MHVAFSRGFSSEHIGQGIVGGRDDTENAEGGWSCGALVRVEFGLSLSPGEVAIVSEFDNFKFRVGPIVGLEGSSFSESSSRDRGILISFVSDFGGLVVNASYAPAAAESAR